MIKLMKNRKKRGDIYRGKPGDCCSVSVGEKNKLSWSGFHQLKSSIEVDTGRTL